MIRHLLQVTLRGAVEGGRSALLPEVPNEWLEPVVLLDSAVQRKRASWLQRLLHRVVPGPVLDAALFELISRQKYVPRYGGMHPAYGIRGSGKGAGLHAIKLSKVVFEEAGCTPLPRMVRTPDGREVLQHQLIKEREAVSDEGPSSA